ncbi:DoxX family protein [Olivibacter ginsenosidimutans]|uniref:DoxX family protein n=1 Tax=Olivibacter ginsenosidimutans TaxID=1176537 RepID=A0ABP9AV84_9SPHI
MRKLFATHNASLSFNIAALILRFGMGILMIPHGYAKLVSFAERKDRFMEFIGLSSSASLGLAIFSELFCAVLLVLGLATRLATIPLIITALVIMSVHHWTFFGDHDLIVALFIGYVAILFLGPGDFSLDKLLVSRSVYRK